MADLLQFMQACWQRCLCKWQWIGKRWGLRVLLWACMVISLSLGQVPAALAQTTPGTVEPPEPSWEIPASEYTGPDVNQISSEKVSQFVHAFLQVLNLMEQREGELQGAETQVESLQIQREIETEALAMIAAAGLSRTEYLQLLGLANTDPEFGERIAAQLQEEMN